LIGGPEFAAKVSETLATASKCAAGDTVENYSLLRSQLEELDTQVAQVLRAHTGQQSLIAKLQDGKPLTADEMKTLRSLIIGDADYYLKYDDDFDRSKNDLVKIIDEIRRLQSSGYEPETLMHLRVLCREAASALVPTMHYLEQRERVRKFEEHTRGPLDSDAGRVLARIIKGMMS
jgi:hypothetical protein